MERMGQPTSTWRYGRGGAGANAPEYNRRIALLTTIRREFMDAFPEKVPYINAGVDPIPINWVNKRLKKLKEDWRVKMGDRGYILPPGAGANAPEYNRRIALLTTIRREFMDAFPEKVPYINAGVDPIPINWVNKRLEELKEDWRVKMGDRGYILPPLRHK
jgi:hypothetical protein